MQVLFLFWFFDVLSESFLYLSSLSAFHKIRYRKIPREHFGNAGDFKEDGKW